MLKQNNILNFLNRFMLLYNSDLSYNAAPEAVYGDVLIHDVIGNAYYVVYNLMMFTVGLLMFSVLLVM